MERKTILNYFTGDYSNNEDFSEAIQKVRNAINSITLSDADLEECKNNAKKTIFGGDIQNKINEIDDEMRFLVSYMLMRNQERKYLLNPSQITDDWEQRLSEAVSQSSTVKAEIGIGDNSTNTTLNTRFVLKALRDNAPLRVKAFPNYKEYDTVLKHLGVLPACKDINRLMFRNKVIYERHGAE